MMSSAKKGSYTFSFLTYVPYVSFVLAGICSTILNRCHEDERFCFGSGSSREAFSVIFKYDLNSRFFFCRCFIGLKKFPPILSLLRGLIMDVKFCQMLIKQKPKACWIYPFWEKAALPINLVFVQFHRISPKQILLLALRQHSRSQYSQSQSFFLPLSFLLPSAFLMKGVESKRPRVAGFLPPSALLQTEDLNIFLNPHVELKFYMLHMDLTKLKHGTQIKNKWSKK